MLLLSLHGTLTLSAAEQIRKWRVLGYEVLACGLAPGEVAQLFRGDERLAVYRGSDWEHAVAGVTAHYLRKLEIEEREKWLAA